MDTPLISILLASYKHAEWLEECINSVLRQTYTHFELIIVDDGSEDGSHEIIKDFAEKDDRISYEVFKKNKGAVVATRRCYELSQGTFIAIINSDDSWHKQKLELQLPHFKNDRSLGAVFCLPQYIDENGNQVLLESHSEFKPSINLKGKYQWLNYFFKEGNCLCHPSILIKKECYETSGFYKSSLRSLPDYEMWVRLLFNYDILVIDQQLVNFRKHDYNESNNSLANTVRSTNEFREVLRNYIEQVESFTELENIFPEEKELLTVKEDSLVKIYLALIALKKKQAPWSNFALNILYEELNKPHILQLVESAGLYSLTQFHKDVYEADIYAIQDLTYYQKNNTNMVGSFKELNEQNKKNSDEKDTLLKLLEEERTKTLSLNATLVHSHDKCALLESLLNEERGKNHTLDVHLSQSHDKSALLESLLNEERGKNHTLDVHLSQSHDKSALLESLLSEEREKTNLYEVKLTTQDNTIKSFETWHKNWRTRYFTKWEK